jgi:hypothetical protein
MILMRYGPFRVAEEFFRPFPAVVPGADLLRSRLVPSPEGLRQVEAQSTVTLSLDQAPEAVFARFGKDNQYKIRRAETKDRVQCRMLDGQSLSSDDLARLQADYRDLVQRKGITPLNLQRLERLRERDQLFIGRADDEEGGTLAWHVYLVAHRRARLLYSVSLFREAESSARRALVGRANRLLHWRDILAFQEAGVELYDFGGYYQGGTDQSKLRINQFKDEFHGDLRTEYNGLRFQGPGGALARLSLAALRWSSRLLGRRDAFSA